MGFKNKIKSFLSVLVLLALTSLLFNNALFLHSHQLSDGSLVSHAHPFTEKQNSGNPAHNHTSEELQLIFVINSLFFALFVTIAAFVFINLFSGVILFEYRQFYTPNSLFEANLLRGPPVC